MRWWGNRIVRFGLLLLALAALLLVPIHLTQTSALVVGIGGLAALALLAVTSVRRLLFALPNRAASSLELLGRSIPVVGGRDVRTLGALMRAVGVAVPALVFFLAWALLFAIIWAAEPSACAVATTRCNGAFTGLGDRPLLGDFVYYAVNLAFANPPPDLVAQSRTARAAATVEIVAAAGFLFAYLAAFFAGRGTGGGQPAAGLRLNSVRRRPLALVLPHPLAHGVVGHPVPAADGAPARRLDLGEQLRQRRAVDNTAVGLGNAGLGPGEARVRAVALRVVLRHEQRAAPVARSRRARAAQGLATVGVQRRGAVRAHDPQVLEAVVGRLAVDVVEDQRHPLAAPQLALAAELAGALLQALAVQAALEVAAVVARSAHEDFRHAARPVGRAQSGDAPRHRIEVLRGDAGAPCEFLERAEVAAGGTEAKPAE